MSKCSPKVCESCVARRAEPLQKMGIQLGKYKYTIALAGNPNTGKSTIFNALTGMRQHTGNWPGKTIARAEGGFAYGNEQYKIVDLPGTYSLLSTSLDEEVARDFILFGQPDATIVVLDATALERNLNLALQIMQITDRVVVAVNLMDEAKASGIEVDCRHMSRKLGVPVVPMAARKGEGLGELLKALQSVCRGDYECRPKRHAWEEQVQQVIERIANLLGEVFPSLEHREWIALRLIDGDERIQDAVRDGSIGFLRKDEVATVVKLGDGSRVTMDEKALSPETFAEGQRIIDEAKETRWELPRNCHDKMVEDLYASAAGVAGECVRQDGENKRRRLQQRLDWLLTSKWTGFPGMVLMLGIVLWLTISGANVPSQMLATLLMDKVYPLLHAFMDWIHSPAWITGLLIDGMYLTAAWVVSVMLPPMAIFFPLFTILEDFGYLPRVAFNLDRLFQKSGAHGKQSLTMAMGFGCNAAGVIAARVIDSPREKLIAIVTNNFALCNGRWPTQILIASLFIGSLVPAYLSGIVASTAVLGVALLGVGLTFVISWMLSHSLLRGTPSSFSLELPPYRPPNILRTLYTSLIDRTLFVLWRAIVFAVPAGVVIWLMCNINIGSLSIAQWMIQGTDPLGRLIGLNGVIIVAYIVAVPANEIVIPTVLMLTVLATGMHVDGAAGQGVLFEISDQGLLRNLLSEGGWTLLTGISIMLFSLCHNPCSTTLYTIYKETGSLRWTIWSAIIPTGIGIILCGLLTLVWHIFL